MRFEKIVHDRGIPDLGAIEPPSLEAARRTARTGPNINHPSVVEMREIREFLHLTSKDLLALYNEELADNPAEQMNHAQFQQMLQGYIRTTERLDQALRTLRTVKQNILDSGYLELSDKTPKQIVATWIDMLGIDVNTHSVYRELALVAQRAIKDINFSTIYRWASSNYKPSSYEKLLAIHKVVKEIGHKWQPGLKPSRRTVRKTVNLD